MGAMVVRKDGAPAVFEAREVPDPQPKAGEALIRVKAIGVNFADLLQRMGIYPGTPKPPFVPGLEIAGVIEKIADSGGKPAEGEPLRVGEAVAALTQFNAYAAWVAVPGRQVYRLPAGMSFDDAAAIPVNYLTAYHSMFTMGNLQPGDRILVHGAAGGVGIAAVQLARARGLVIFGTAGPTKQEYLRKIGVDHAIDYEQNDFVEGVRQFAPDGIWRVIYDLSAATGPDGKRSLTRGLKTLAQIPRFHPMKLMSGNISVIGVNLGRLQSRGALLRGELDEIFRMYATGKIKPVIGKSFPLAEAAAAHRYIQERKNIGKVILTVK